MSMNVFPLVGESRIAPNYEQAGDTREISGQALCDTIDKVFLFRVTADIAERQNHDGEAWWTGLVRLRDVRRRRSPRRATSERIDTHLLRDILELLLTKVAELLGY